MKAKTTLLLICAIALLGSCQQTATTDTPASKKGLIKVTILYPNGEGNTFDMDYYTNNHMPMVADLLGESLKFLEIDKGVSGRTPDDPIPFMAIGYLYFEKLSDYQEAFAPHAQRIVSDIPNYTNVQPVLQISEVLE